MKKILFASVFMIHALGNAVAQNEVKYEKLYYKDSKVETSEITIEVGNAVSTAGETKFKLKIINKTTDYILFKPEESEFVIDGKKMKVVEKSKLIEPNDFATWVINLKGSGYNSVKNYSFVLDGLYKVSARIQGITVPDYRLPVSQNDFMAGSFSCSIDKLTKETDKTEAKFKCAYNGEKIGFIFPSRVAVKMPDGKDYANARSKSKVIMLMKGETDTFTLQWNKMDGGKTMDMQFAEMMIKWNEAFVDAAPEKMKTETIELTFDQAMSDAKGK